MITNKVRKAPWYPQAVAICIGVVLYILLSRFSGIWAGIRAFLGYFEPVLLGCAIAYVVNPLSKLISRLFTFIRKEETRRVLSNILAFLAVVLFLVFVLLVLVPQIVESLRTFVGNLDGYIASVNRMLENWGLSKQFDSRGLIASTENLLNSISDYIANNYTSILSTSASVGKDLFRLVISFFLSIYLLTEKPKLKVGTRRLLRAALGDERFRTVRRILRKSNEICSRYIVSTLLDSLIVGAANALFMTAFGMQYVGLVSFVAAVTNLVPTFGPMVGMLVSGFILLMVEPIHVLIFFAFTLLLQTCDAYVIKPRLFGNSLGVSGLLILVGVVVGGNIFGVTGILLAVPGVAILDYLYDTMFLPWLEKKNGIREKDAGGPE